MMNERIVICDANILFDLHSAELLWQFFELPWEIRTTDLVIGEITKPELLDGIEGFWKKKTERGGFELQEIFEISALLQSCGNNVSMPDCSVWHYAKKVGGRLLTGD